MRSRTHTAGVLLMLLAVVPTRAVAQGPTVVINPASVTGSMTASGAVTLPSPAPAGGVVVQLISNNPAVSVPATVAIPANVNTANFNITTVTVAQKVTVVITATVNGVSGTGRLTVLAPIPMISAYLESTNNKPGGLVRISAPAPAGGITVSLTSNNPALITMANPDVFIREGTSQINYGFSVAPVAQSTGITITASTSAGSASTSLTLLPPTISGFSVSGGTSPSGSDVTATGGKVLNGGLTLSSNSPAGFVIQFSSSNPAVVPAPPDHNFPAGNGKSSVAIPTQPVSQQTNVQLIARLGSQADSVTLRLDPPTISTLTISPGSILGGQSATATATLDAPAPAGGINLQLSTIGSLNLNLPTPIIVPAGQSIKTFPIPTPQVNQNTTVEVKATRLSSSGSVSRSANLVVQSPAPSSLTLSRSTTFGAQGGLHLQVVLNAPAPQGGLIVQLASSHTVLLVPQTITIPQGQTSSGDIGIAYQNVVSRVTATVTATAGGVSKTATLVLNP